MSTLNKGLHAGGGNMEEGSAALSCFTAIRGVSDGTGLMMTVSNVNTQQGATCWRREHVYVASQQSRVCLTALLSPPCQSVGNRDTAVTTASQVKTKSLPRLRVRQDELQGRFGMVRRGCDGDLRRIRFFLFFPHDSMTPLHLLAQELFQTPERTFCARAFFGWKSP